MEPPYVEADYYEGQLLSTNNAISDQFAALVENQKLRVAGYIFSIKVLTNLLSRA